LEIRKAELGDAIDASTALFSTLRIKSKRSRK